MRNRYLLTLLILSATSGCGSQNNASVDHKRWLAGDHHIHSRFSTGWDRTQTPPMPILGGDAIYTTPKNAEMASQFGLSWMVTTDHGGPNHSKVNLNKAYPELLQSRKDLPHIIQFYGMELNTPAGDHSSLIVPHTPDESSVLFDLESTFDTLEAFPLDPSRDREQRMIEALAYMQNMHEPPIVIANHPSRSAHGEGQYGLYEPREFRRWNDTAPQVAVGMAGAPGHQAIALSTNPNITSDAARVRGGYRLAPTKGGFDPMTAVVGGFWDSMLGEGRRWWITANSDSHIHYSEGGIDFWPGEYSKTYVFAEKKHESILASLRAGHIFVTTGDLISALDFSIEFGDQRAMIGEQLSVPDASELVLTISFEGRKHPSVARVDLIAGSIGSAGADPDSFRNETTHVVKRLSEFVEEDGKQTIQFSVKVDGPTYFRVRGTNTNELEPLDDPPAENPWDDLWFYSNPIFVVIGKDTLD